MLPTIRQLGEKQINQANAGPLAAYGQQLHKNTDDMNEALQGVAVDGLKSLEDGLTGLITGTKSVSEAFRDMATAIIADLARIAIQKAVVSLLGSAFGGGFADGGLVNVPGYASGGLITGPGGPRSDSMLARVSNGEFVVNAAATSRFRPTLEAMNGGGGRMPAFDVAALGINTNARAATVATGPSEIVLHVAAGEYFDARVASVSGPIARDTSVQVVRAAAPEIAKSTLRQTPGYLRQSQQYGQPRTI